MNNESGNHNFLNGASRFSFIPHNDPKQVLRIRRLFMASTAYILNVSRSELEKSLSIIQEISIRDALTGFYNRRHLMELLDHEKNRSLRGNTVFTIAMLDIDHFKKVNDTYGHQSGDEVLRTVSTVIRNTMRSTDFCGRYGGEEFVLVLIQTDIKEAMIGAERIRVNIEKCLFPNIGADFRVTVSLGLAEYQMREDVETMIARADRALYQAKNGGRNRVEYAT